MSINAFKKYPGNKITFSDRYILYGKLKVMGSIKLIYKKELINWQMERHLQSYAVIKFAKRYYVNANCTFMRTLISKPAYKFCYFKKTAAVLSFSAWAIVLLSKNRLNVIELN